MNLAVNNNSNLSVASSPAFSAVESGGTKGAQTRDQAVDKLVDMLKNGQIAKDSPLGQMVSDKMHENTKGALALDPGKELKKAVSDVLQDKVPDLGGRLPQAGGPDVLQQALDGLNKASVQDFVKTNDDGGADIKGSESQGKAIGQFMDQHPDLYPKPDVGDGEKVNSWEDELSNSDKTLNSAENSSVQAAIKDITAQMDAPGANQPSGVGGQGSTPSGGLGDPVGQSAPQNQGNGGLLNSLGDVEKLLQLLTGQGQGQGQGQNVSGNQPASNAGDSGNSQGAGGAGGALQQLQDLVQQLLALLTGQGGQADQGGGQNNQNNQNSQNSQFNQFVSR